jgi:hypothetical protein
LSSKEYNVLHQMRLKVLDVSYKMTYEKKVAEEDVYSFFLSAYAEMLRKTFRIAQNNLAITATKGTVMQNHKTLDGILLLYNEVVVYVCLKLATVTKANLSYQYMEDTHSLLHFSCDATTEIPLTEIHHRFAQAHKTTISTRFDGHCYEISLLIPNT